MDGLLAEPGLQVILAATAVRVRATALQPIPPMSVHILWIILANRVCT